MFDRVVEVSRASQDKSELKGLLSSLVHVFPKIIVEIGVHQGYSLEIWHRAFRPAMLIGIENDCHALDPKVKELSNVTILELDSHKPETLNTLMDEIAGMSVDFLFIDGDHSYEGVKRDFDLYAPLVKDGGAVAFHDIRLDQLGVKRFWEEIKLEFPKQFKEIFSESGTGTGILFL